MSLSRARVGGEHSIDFTTRTTQHGGRRPGSRAGRASRPRGVDGGQNPTRPRGSAAADLFTAIAPSLPGRARVLGSQEPSRGLGGASGGRMTFAVQRPRVERRVVGARRRARRGGLHEQEQRELALPLDRRGRPGAHRSLHVQHPGGLRMRDERRVPQRLRARLRLPRRRPVREADLSPRCTETYPPDLFDDRFEQRDRIMFGNIVDRSVTLFRGLRALGPAGLQSGQHPGRPRWTRVRRGLLQRGGEPGPGRPRPHASRGRVGRVPGPDGRGACHPGPGHLGRGPGCVPRHGRARRADDLTVGDQPGAHRSRPGPGL